MINLMQLRAAVVVAVRRFGCRILDKPAGGEGQAVAQTVCLGIAQETN
jgi:hypothetical protein